MLISFQRKGPFASPGLQVVVYRSRETPIGGMLAESGALDRFIRRNEAKGITGYLHYENGTFYQHIEGEADAVARLWQAIQADPRHDAVTALHMGPLSARRFPRWSMGWNEGSRRSLFDWLSRSRLTLKGRHEWQVVSAFLEYASGAAKLQANPA